MSYRTCLVVAALLPFLQPPSLSGQAAQSQSPEIAELQRKVDVLAEEVERLRSGEAETDVPLERTRQLGLGPSAAAVYGKSRGFSLAGYGEFLYENFAARNQTGTSVSRPTQWDSLRAVIYAGYRFNDRVVFNSEIEVEHANEIWLEFAYIDYTLRPEATLRGGLVLVPMGLMNEFHEPNVFFGARRSETESRIIPSTWRENGFGVLGSAGIFSYRAYVVNGMNAAGYSADGFRGGRQRGSRARAGDMAVVGRLDVTPIPGVFFGGSVYSGGSAQNQYQVDGRTIQAQTTIGEIHGQAQFRGLDLRGLFARTHLGDAVELNRARNLTGTASIGKAMQGGYAQVGYNVLSQVRPDLALTPYYRYERVNTQRKTASGFAADPARDGTFHTLGAEFRPIDSVVIKADHQWSRNRANTGVNQVNIALGYSF
jgi:hypothetical protein